jgi:dTDP-4-amino-4,6-dideoxygalactose transaminase
MKVVYKIPFNKPFVVGTEFSYIQSAIDNKNISGSGAFTQKCQDFLASQLTVPKVLLTPSCTHALEMSALLLDIQAGDEIIVPSFTFVSTVNAFVLRGAKPIFADIRSDTLNLDETLLPDLISSRTKAIVPVHYAGVGCEMDSILTLARQYNIAVVEDNAHGLFGQYRGKNLGTLGDLATQSFHETKNFTCGEGGALLINTPRYIPRAEIIREKGTNRSRFLRGEVDKYTWVDIGSSYLPSDIASAFLYAQLQAYKQIQNIREKIWQTYYLELHAWATLYGVRLPFVPTHCQQSFHMFYLLMPSSTVRDRFINYLKTLGIYSVFHYIPLHNSPMGQTFGGHDGMCPITEDVSSRLVRLPFFNSLSMLEQKQVIEAITQFTQF